jgi:hypothetical protein
MCLYTKTKEFPSLMPILMSMAGLLFLTKVCKTCTNLLESAYVFRQMCRVAYQPNYNVCRCCLQENSDINDQFLNMKNAVFEHNNKSVTSFEGYFYVNSLEDSASFRIPMSVSAKTVQCN